MKKVVILICFLMVNQWADAQDWRLVWNDEFDYTGLPDNTKWSYDVGDGCPNVCGWGNNERQYYTEDRLENGRVENGLLIIEAHKEKMGDREYSSVRLVSKNKGDWLYGKIVVRAKLPTGKGTWPAIWMLPTEWQYGGWPASGEIDIMEHVGYDQDVVHGTVHTKAYNHVINTQRGKTRIVESASASFHEYSVEWDAEKIIFYIDGLEYNRFENEHKTSDEWPFDNAFHLIMNIAVGGNWGGKEGVDDSIWPQRMEVDWVRVYQK